MEAIDLLRRAAATNSARFVGLRTDQPVGMVTQNKAAFHLSDILSLPVDSRNWAKLQKPDGTFYSMVDFDAIDGGAPIR